MPKEEPWRSEPCARRRRRPIGQRSGPGEGLDPVDTGELSLVIIGRVRSKHTSFHTHAAACLVSRNSTYVLR